MSAVGFYGKLAGRGDFIHRGLPSSFIEPWDAWLAAGIASSQAQLGGGWLDAYLVSPLWRFAVAPGLLGSEAVTGVMMPSIDRVGRYFPLCIARLLEPDADLASLVSGPQQWFERVEALLLSTLDEDAEFEAFEAAVSALDSPPCGQRLAYSRELALVHFNAASGVERAQALAQLSVEGASLWWGQGSERLAASLQHCLGLPAPQLFSRFLLGPAGAAGMVWQLDRGSRG